MLRVVMFGQRLSLRQHLQQCIGHRGFIIATPSEENDFLESVCLQRPDLIVIDFVVNPSLGKRLGEEIREMQGYETVPLLAVTTPRLLHQNSLPKAFDDFLLEPFEAIELQTRIERLLAHSPSGPMETRLVLGPLTIDLEGHEVTLHGQLLDLTYKEYELLRFLASYPGVVFRREQLLNRVWGGDFYGGTRTVDVHIRRLRAKLGDLAGQMIQTVRGVGYKFKPLESRLDSSPGERGRRGEEVPGARHEVL